MSLGFGLLSAQARPGVHPDWEQAYEHTIALTEHAEARGYSSVWTTEHHFVDDGYMPSLLVTSAALAARTERIAIGTGVLLAPMHDPLRLAEDAATVQLISKGRLILGLGLGWSAVEYAALGPGKRLRGAALTEILRILPKAWSGEPFRHEGQVYDLPEVGVRPRPAHPIPVVIGGSAEPAVRRAARLADGLFANVPPDTFLRMVGWAREELERSGRDPKDFRWIHYSVMYPAASAAQGWEEIGDHLWAMAWKYRDMEASATRSGPVAVPPPVAASGPDELGFRSTLIGPADWIVEQLRELREAAGVPLEFVARSFFHTLPHVAQLELMDALAAAVLPHL